MYLRLRLLVKLFIAVTLVIGGQYSLVMAEKILSVDFEVFGIVQGVFFRKWNMAEFCLFKNTVMKGTELGLKGWCMNTSQGTVRGQMEGPKKEIDQMKHWLQYTGSPMSRIDKAVFTNEKDIDKYSFTNFSVRH
ncbi:hypothetical protein J437_LFUL009013 [Ladona fulva]|uniref:Acylphosphatase n=1 Tax=Ladona fulva TaxID=123851 RepID=A0A8K0K6W8_LADFU|nr:hypothetical protein J437_LFUL009013 [Ladona fulva]